MCVCGERIFVWFCASVFVGTYVRVCVCVCVGMCVGVCVCGHVCIRRALASCAVSRFRKVMIWVCRVRGVRSARKRLLSLWYTLCVLCHLELLVCHVSHVTSCVSCLNTLDCYFSFLFLGGVLCVQASKRAHASHSSTDSFILSSDLYF